MSRFEAGGGMRGEDDVEKVGRTSEKILATPLLKPEKTTGVLNVLIICPGSHFQGSVDHLAIQFSTAKKTLSHDNTFKISDFPITCSRAVCHLRIIVITYIWKSIYYQIYGIICPCFVRGLISLFRCA